MNRVYVNNKSLQTKIGFSLFEIVFRFKAIKKMKQKNYAVGAMEKELVFRGSGANRQITSNGCV